MHSDQTIDDILVAEVKKDIAGRYFGFRKLIEDEKMDLEEKIKQYSFILQKRISFDLIRIYIMLRDEALIENFLSLIPLDKKLFYDPYLTESATIALRVFECQRFRGFSKAGRFKKYFFHCYECLASHTNKYNEKIKELQEQRGLIAEDVKLFYRQNDMSAIMGFLRTLGGENTGPMQGGLEVGVAETLNNRLHIAPPLPIEQILPIIPALPPLSDIKGSMKVLIKKAYSNQTPEFLKIFKKTGTPCDHRDSSSSA